MAAPRISQLGGGIAREDIGNSTQRYEEYFDGANGAGTGNGASQRTSNYADVVNKYYDLATSFYEYGWGHSFHFAHRFATETLAESITRHEHYLALRAQIGPGHKVLDLGCGVGGPARCIAAFTGASVTGINNNDHQLQRAEALTAATWSRYHTGSCRFVKGDFMDLRALGLDAYDAAYQIEATCHAPDIAAVYVQIFNALKPGGMFASYEWCMTSAFDTRNEEHVRLKHDILKGNGLPDLRTTSQVMDALKAAGFEVLDSQDVALTSQVPWYAPLDCSQPLLKAAFSRTGGGFRTSRLGRAVTRKAVYVLESMRIAPRGTCQVSAFLEQGADALVAGGKQGIFTPMWFTLVRKPLHTAAPARAPRGGGGQRGTGTLVIGTGDDVHIQPSRSVSLAGTAALGTQDVGKQEVRSGQQQRSQASPGPSGAGLTPNRRSSRRAAE